MTLFDNKTLENNNFNDNDEKKTNWNSMNFSHFPLVAALLFLGSYMSSQSTRLDFQQCFFDPLLMFFVWYIFHIESREDKCMKLIE